MVWRTSNWRNGPSSDVTRFCEWEGPHICYMLGIIHGMYWKKATYVTILESGKSEHLYVSFAISDDWEITCWCTCTVASMHGPINVHHPWSQARKRLKYRITRVLERICTVFRMRCTFVTQFAQIPKNTVKIHEKYTKVFTEEGRTTLEYVVNTL